MKDNLSELEKLIEKLDPARDFWWTALCGFGMGLSVGLFIGNLSC